MTEFLFGSGGWGGSALDGQEEHEMRMNWYGKCENVIDLMPNSKCFISRDAHSITDNIDVTANVQMTTQGIPK